MRRVAPLDTSNATPEQKALALKYAAEIRKFEIGLLWQRSLFFWGFLAAAFTAYGVLYKNGHNDLCVVIACFGVACSVAWTLQNRGSKYWQEAWEQKVNAVEWDVLRCHLFSNIEPRKSKTFWGARRFSVSSLAIALSDFSVGVWIILVVAAVSDWTIGYYLSLPVLLIALTAVYVVAIGISSRRDDKESD
jgi:hypothetical protein